MYEQHLGTKRNGTNRTAQAIVAKKKARLNHITFNPSEPIILVGDSKGIVHSLKVSLSFLQTFQGLSFIK
jgi:hypothetical protein